jgi:hypothetical protein
MIEQTPALRAQWVKVADHDGHVHLEERWVVKRPADKGDGRIAAGAKRAKRAA